jgi:hypothetical protein
MEHVLTHNVIVTYVRITTHPCRTVLRASSQPLYAAEANWKLKHSQYVRAHVMAENAIEPLVFEVYGGYSDRTYEFLRSLVNTIAGNDNDLFPRLCQDLHDRIAVALAKGETIVIRCFFTYNSGQHFRSSRRSTASEQQQQPPHPLAPMDLHFWCIAPCLFRLVWFVFIYSFTTFSHSSSVPGPPGLPSTVSD